MRLRGITSSSMAFLSFFFFFYSLKKTYGDIFSLKVGGYNLIMASSSEAVKEMLVKKSADFSGRSDLYTFYKITLGVYIMDDHCLFLLI